MTDDFDDLLGEVKPKKPLGRPPKAVVAERERQRQLEMSDPEYVGDLEVPGSLPDASRFFRPVGVTYLGTVLGIEPRRLHKKLAKCTVVGYGSNGRGKGAPLYDFKEALRYCVEPRIDLKTWFSSLSTTTMPPIISKAFWEAIRMKNKVMEESGKYWHTEDILEVLGETAKMIKETALLWIEDLPSKHTISSEDHHALRKHVNEMLADVQKKLIDMPKGTRSVAHTIEREIEESDLTLKFDDDE